MVNIAEDLSIKEISFRSWRQPEQSKMQSKFRIYSHPVSGDMTQNICLCSVSNEWQLLLSGHINKAKQGDNVSEFTGCFAAQEWPKF